jgi:TM2 domain-containing membrane protein YozV
MDLFVIDTFDFSRKTKRSAYALLLLFGLLGWHAFYMKKKLRGFLYLAGFAALMAGWRKHILLLACISGAFLLLLWLFDLFTLRKQVDKWNEAVDMRAGKIVGVKGIEGAEQVAMNVEVWNG